MRLANARSLAECRVCVAILAVRNADRYPNDATHYRVREYREYLRLTARRRSAVFFPRRPTRTVARNATSPRLRLERESVSAGISRVKIVNATVTDSDKKSTSTLGLDLRRFTCTCSFLRSSVLFVERGGSWSLDRSITFFFAFRTRDEKNEGHLLHSRGVSGRLALVPDADAVSDSCTESRVKSGREILRGRSYGANCT